MSRPEAAALSIADADALAVDLAGLGFDCTVEARAALALLVLHPTELERMRDPDTRRTIQRVARARGFTHCAVELGAVTPAQRADSALPRE